MVQVCRIGESLAWNLLSTQFQDGGVLKRQRCAQYASSNVKYFESNMKKIARAALKILQHPIITFVL